MPIITKKSSIALAAIGGAVFLYAGIGFWLLPAIAQQKLPAIIAEQTGQQATIQAVHFNPFSLQLSLQGFAIPAKDGKTLIGFDDLSVDVNAIESLQIDGVVLDAVTLSQPVLNLQRREDGSFNVSDLQVKASSEPEQSTDTPSLALLIHHIQLDAGHVAWLDSADSKSESILPINLSVAELTTQIDGKSSFVLNLQLASGGNLQWQGDFNLDQLSSHGQLKLDDLSLPKVWELFLQQHLPVVISQGQLALQADYAMTAKQAFALIVSNGRLDIKQLALAEKNHAAGLISIPSLALQGISVDTGKQQVSVSQLSSNAGQIKAWLQKDGQLNYQSLFAPAAAKSKASPAKATTENAKLWQIQFNELALQGYQLQFNDYSLSNPVAMQLTELNCKLKQFNTEKPNAKLPLEFSGKLNKSAAVNINGDLRLEPFATQLAVNIKDISLKPLQSYIEPYVKLEIVDGSFSSQGQLGVALDKQLAVNFEGDANIDNLITRDKVKNKDFLKWADLALQQLNIDVAKQQYTIGKVLIDQPYLRFNIKKDGTNNISDVLVTQAETGKHSSPDKTNKTDQDHASKISIGKISLHDGKSNFVDNSLILPFVAEMNGLDGEIDGFSSDKNAVAKLKLQGRVYDLASVNIKGQYQLQTGDSDITLSYTHMPLPLITPYMAEFAGYKIEKGQMALDLHYNIKKGLLAAENKILIDQLQLGDKVENPHAVSLPLELAIALLKDGQGKINLDFPVTGSLDDPQFSVGSLIADVLQNIVAKVAAAPFKAMGSLFSNSEQDFSAIDFAAGTTQLTATETAKLDDISKALVAKPDLAIDIKGMAYQVQDWPVMRADAVTDVLKKMKSGELRDKGEKIRMEYIELSDSETKRLLAKFYAEVLPSEIDYNSFGNPRMKNNPDVDFYSTARMQLEAIMQPETQRLNDLAIARANSIAKYLSQHAGIDRNRIFILATDLAIGEAGKPAHAVLSLSLAS